MHFDHSIDANGVWGGFVVTTFCCFLSGGTQATDLATSRSKSINVITDSSKRGMGMVVDGWIVGGLLDDRRGERRAGTGVGDCH